MAGAAPDGVIGHLGMLPPLRAFTCLLSQRSQSPLSCLSLLSCKKTADSLLLPDELREEKLLEYLCLSASHAGTSATERVSPAANSNRVNAAVAMVAIAAAAAVAGVQAHGVRRLLLGLPLRTDGADA
eukprot:GHVU01210386.1.p1 GENE.GHVU01210386.1~~GHVU01210386.1.p1  ORF type:complete len:128 (+),score=6.54 GHVU01210386.1:177-560(+)